MRLKYGLIGTNQASAAPMSVRSLIAASSQTGFLGGCRSRYVSAVAIWRCRYCSASKKAYRVLVIIWEVGRLARHIRILGLFFVSRLDGVIYIFMDFRQRM